MSLFKGINQIFRTIGVGQNKVLNSEKAKRSKKLLLRNGITMIVLGVIGVITCLVVAFTCPFESDRFMLRAIPIFFAVFSFALACFGGVTTFMGVSLKVASETSQVITEEIGFNCPNCGIALTYDGNFCPNCGAGLKNLCPNCQTENEATDKFCKNCGRQLLD